jgi:hypothetical protein
VFNFLGLGTVFDGAAVVLLKVNHDQIVLLYKVSHLFIAQVGHAVYYEA